MGSDAARLSHSASPQPDPARTLPRLGELDASSSTRPSSSASLNVLLNPVLDDEKLAAGQQRGLRPAPLPSAWTAVNHPPRANSVLEPRVSSHYDQPQYQCQSSPGVFSHAGQPSSINQEQSQPQRLTKDDSSLQPAHDDSSASTQALLGPFSSSEPPAITVVWGSVARSRSRSSKPRGQQQRSPLSIAYARAHTATPPSPAPSPELESPGNPSVSQFPAPQPSFTSGHHASEAPAPISISESQQSFEFARPTRIVRFNSQSNTMPMSPPPNPPNGGLNQSPMVIETLPQPQVVSPSSPDVCTRCYSFYLQQFHAAMQHHEQQSQQMSLSRNSQEDYNRFLEAGRASIAGVRLQFDSIRQMCPDCAGKPPEDSVENVKVAFRDVMPIRDHPATCAQSGKRKLDSEHGLVEDESLSKSRRVSPELATPALCESTPPPEPDSRAGTAKFLLGDVNDLFVGFYRPRPHDDVVPTGPLERTARSLGLAAEKPSNVSARNEPAPDDWTNMWYDPVIDLGKISVSGRLAPGTAREKSPDNTK